MGIFSSTHSVNWIDEETNPDAEQRAKADRRHEAETIVELIEMWLGKEAAPETEEEAFLFVKSYQEKNRRKPPEERERISFLLNRSAFLKALGREKEAKETKYIRVSAPGGGESLMRAERGPLWLQWGTSEEKDAILAPEGAHGYGQTDAERNVAGVGGTSKASGES